MERIGVLEYEGWAAVYVDGKLDYWGDGDYWRDLAERLAKELGVKVEVDPDYLYNVDDPDNPDEEWPLGIEVKK